MEMPDKSRKSLVIQVHSEGLDELAEKADKATEALTRLKGVADELAGLGVRITTSPAEG